MKNIFRSSFILFFCFLQVVVVAQKKILPFQNAKLSIDARINDLLNRLTVEERISMLGFRSKEMQRLDIPQYNWWNEGMHGVSRAGKATIFPQSIAMAASFNDELMHEIATVISTEARAKYNMAIQQNRRLQYMGLTFWSPNINIFRDPRWGRGQETYGEDPFLTGQIGTAYIKGMQGKDKNFLKTSACAKHFAVHSGPENIRHSFDAVVDEKDLRETYLYAFKKLVDAGVESIMCAYNRVNTEPCCTGNTLLKNILREEWKFKGHVVTDCWALEDIWLRHKTLPNSVSVAAAAIKAGINVDCSNLLQDDVMKAVDQKLLTVDEINKALTPSLNTLFKLGFFDKNKKNAFQKYGADSVANSYHLSLTRKMAAQSMVLLKNDTIPGKLQPLLPLKKSDYSAYMVIGPTAASLDALIGNYHAVSDKAVNFVEGISSAVNAGTRVEYDMGCDFNDTIHFGGIWAASNAEITIAAIGFTPVYEGEEGDAFLAAGGGDRTNFELPASQIAFMKKLRNETKTPIIAVITAGSAVNISAIEKYADAIIYAWYPGEQGGHALADILFGNVSPSGHLPITFYKSFSDLPAYNSYDMQGRTYRYFDKEVQYPFGFGLSYTTFAYKWSQKPNAIHSLKDTINFSVKIKNTGMYNADEVVQVYIEYPPADRMPIKELKAFKRVNVLKGKEATVSLSIPASELQKWDLEKKQWKLYEGDYKIIVGSDSRDSKLQEKFQIN